MKKMKKIWLINLCRDYCSSCCTVEEIREHSNMCDFFTENYLDNLENIICVFLVRCSNNARIPSSLHRILTFFTESLNIRVVCFQRDQHQQIINWMFHVLSNPDFSQSIVFDFNPRDYLLKPLVKPEN